MSPIGSVGRSVRGRRLPDEAEVPEDDLIHRYVASDIDASDGDAVSTWPDRISGLNLTGGSPLFNGSSDRLGAKASVNFDGVDDILTTDDFDSALAERQIIAVAADVDADRDILHEGGDSDATHQLRIEEDTDTDRIFNGDGLNTSDSGKDTESIYNTFINGDTGDGFVRRNGSLTGEGDVGTRNLESLHVGGSTSFDPHFEGEVSEVLVYDRELSADENESVENYLADKYEISL